MSGIQDTSQILKCEFQPLTDQVGRQTVTAIFQILDFCIPGFVFKDPALTSADRDSACCIRDRAIAGLCRCIWNMICRLCIGPQHILTNQLS